MFLLFAHLYAFDLIFLCNCTLISDVIVNFYSYSVSFWHCITILIIVVISFSSAFLQIYTHYPLLYFCRDLILVPGLGLINLLLGLLATPVQVCK